MSLECISFMFVAVVLFIICSADMRQKYKKENEDYIFEPYGGGFKKIRKVKR